MIGLSVTLGLLLLAILVAAVFYKREVITDWLSHRRQALKKEPLKESSSQRSSLTDKQRRNNQGLFNLQSVTIHTSRTQQEQLPSTARPAVGPSQPGVMREMSSELEDKLAGRQASRELDRQLDRQQRKSAAPRAPPLPPPSKQSSAGIKFNERAEVVELEKDKR